MKAKEPTETPLRIFGIDRIIAVLNETGIPHQELAKWDEQQLETTLHQLNPGSPSKRIPDRLKKDLMKTQHIRENTLFISDNPRMISRMTGKDMALVLGLDLEANNQKALYESGADLVLESMEDFKIISGNHQTASFTQSFQSAFQYIENHRATLDQQRPLFFFDYDGTLSPIVKDPNKAFLRPSVRKLLQKLSDYYQVAIVSGRDLLDVRAFVKLDQLIYAGSHGYRITGPGGISWTHSEAEKAFPLLDQVEENLRKKFSEREGIKIERKFSALAVHYRNAPKYSHKKINLVVDGLLREIPELKKGRGKKIVEIKPAFDWNKGKAVDWILRKMGFADPEEYHPVYVGDDVTDEDAFRALADHGTSILVGDHGEVSAADMQLRDSGQVEELLHVLVQDFVLDPQISPTFS